MDNLNLSVLEGETGSPDSFAGWFQATGSISPARLSVLLSALYQYCDWKYRHDEKLAPEFVVATLHVCRVLRNAVSQSDRHNSLELLVHDFVEDVLYHTARGVEPYVIFGEVGVIVDAVGSHELFAELIEPMVLFLAGEADSPPDVLLSKESDLLELASQLKRLCEAGGRADLIAPLMKYGLPPAVRTRLEGR